VVLAAARRRFRPRCSALGFMLYRAMIAGSILMKWLLRASTWLCASWRIREHLSEDSVESLFDSRLLSDAGETDRQLPDEKQGPADRSSLKIASTASVSAMAMEPPVNKDDQETEQRLQRILQGAFSGPPTPLKDIPKRNGEHREMRATKPAKKKGG
jgi:hypothetical protein